MNHRAIPLSQEQIGITEGRIEASASVAVTVITIGTGTVIGNESESESESEIGSEIESVTGKEKEKEKEKGSGSGNGNGNGNVIIARGIVDTTSTTTITTAGLPIEILAIGILATCETREILDTTVTEIIGIRGICATYEILEMYEGKHATTETAGKHEIRAMSDTLVTCATFAMPATRSEENCNCLDDQISSPTAAPTAGRTEGSRPRRKPRRR